MKLPKLCKKARPQCGDLNIIFNVVNKIESKNCEHMIIKYRGNSKQEKDDYEEDQDIWLFFKELDIC